MNYSTPLQKAKRGDSWNQAVGLGLRNYSGSSLYIGWMGMRVVLRTGWSFGAKLGGCNHLVRAMVAQRKVWRQSASASGAYLSGWQSLNQLMHACSTVAPLKEVLTAVYMSVWWLISSLSSVLSKFFDRSLCVTSWCQNHVKGNEVMLKRFLEKGYFCDANRVFSWLLICCWYW